MKENNVTQKLIKYISENNLCVVQIEKDTRVKHEKLKPGYRGKLNATEFLELCSYLNLKPEDYYEK